MPHRSANAALDNFDGFVLCSLLGRSVGKRLTQMRQMRQMGSRHQLQSLVTYCRIRSRVQHLQTQTRSDMRSQLWSQLWTHMNRSVEPLQSLNFLNTPMTAVPRTSAKGSWEPHGLTWCTRVHDIVVICLRVKEQQNGWDLVLANSL